MRVDFSCVCLFVCLCVCALMITCSIFLHIPCWSCTLTEIRLNVFYRIKIAILRILFGNRLILNSFDANAVFSLKIKLVAKLSLVSCFLVPCKIIELQQTFDCSLKTSIRLKETFFFSIWMNIFSSFEMNLFSFDEIFNCCRLKEQVLSVSKGNKWIPYQKQHPQPKVKCLRLNKSTNSGSDLFFCFEIIELIHQIEFFFSNFLTKLLLWKEKNNWINDWTSSDAYALNWCMYAWNRRQN